MNQNVAVLSAEIVEVRPHWADDKKTSHMLADVIWKGGSAQLEFPKIAQPKGLTTDLVGTQTDCKLTVALTVHPKFGPRFGQLLTVEPLAPKSSK